MMPVRILVADDHEIVRRGVRMLIEGRAGWIVCGEAATGREAVAKAVDLRPDIVVLDVSMPELNGLEAARQIRRLVPAKIVVLTVHESERMVTDALASGAQGYVLKTDAGRNLVEAIEALLHGRKFFTERVNVITGRVPHHVATRGPGRLTTREREVLQLLTEGRSNREIGGRLGVTTKTVETHRARIFAKLGIHSMSALVRYAIRNEIIEP